MQNLKEIAQRIFLDTLAGIHIPAVLERKLARAGPRIHVGDTVIDLAKFRRISVIAIGKASHAMAAGLVSDLEPEFWGTPNHQGVLSAPTPSPAPLPGFRNFQGGHPVPNEESFAAARATLDLLAQADEGTIVFFLLSGGGSALAELPLDPKITLDDFRGLHHLLVTCGAPIAEINAVRKHLSALKGGRLAEAAGKATKVTLGVTDVPAGRESALASGPTLPDPTTVADALRVVREYNLLEKLPAPIRAVCASGNLGETPKQNHPAFAKAHFHLLLGMHDLFHHAHKATEARGFVTICDNTTDDWPLARAADFLLEKLSELVSQHPGRPTCVIADGELLSPVTSDGLGGRNSAFVLECVERIAGKGIAVLSGGTDGADGNSPAAGAVADGETLARARAAGMSPKDYFRRSDSFTFFEELGDAIITGPTGNNLRDLRILLASPQG